MRCCESLPERSRHNCCISMPASLRFGLDADHLPVRIIYTDEGNTHVQIDITQAKLLAPWEADAWKLHPAPGDTVQTVAVSHPGSIPESRAEDGQ